MASSPLTGLAYSSSSKTAATITAPPPSLFNISLSRTFPLNFVHTINPITSRDRTQGRVHAFNEVLALRRGGTSTQARKMRLINTTTICLHEFLDDQIPLYVILSHRWEGAEVTFQDLNSGKGAYMSGYAKILGCCAQAREDGFEFAVCCSFILYRCFLLSFSKSIVIFSE